MVSTVLTPLKFLSGGVAVFVPFSHNPVRFPLTTTHYGRYSVFVAQYFYTVSPFFFGFRSSFLPALPFPPPQVASFPPLGLRSSHRFLRAEVHVFVLSFV